MTNSLHRRAARYAWALLLAWIYEVFPLLRTKCGGEMRIIAFINEAMAVREILACLGEPTSARRRAPAGGPLLRVMADAGSTHTEGHGRSDGLDAVPATRLRRLRAGNRAMGRPSMKSLPEGYRAIVLGATGAIGSAFERALSRMPGCAGVIGLGRRSDPGFDLENEASIAACARTVAPRGPFELIIDATGALTIDGVGPEKRLRDLDAAHLARAFAVNAIGPALLLKHFIPLLPTKSRCLFATLSARVGSIGDNRKGGWYGYRASKAALNMLLRTAAVEACRQRPEAVFAALQPGTVRSPLSASFLAGAEAMDPDVSAALLLDALDVLPASGAAVFVDYQGRSIEW